MPSLTKIFLFNLCEITDISIRTIHRLYDGINSAIVDEEQIQNVLGTTNTSQKIIDSLSLIDKTKLSLFALTIVDINISIIEVLRNSYDSIAELYAHKEELPELNIQSRTIVKISSFFESSQIRNQISKLIKIDETDHLLLELKKFDNAVKISDFYSLIGRKYGFTNIQTFSSVINQLANQNKIKITGNGILLKKEKLSSYISNHINEKEIEILNYYLSGNTLEETAKKYGVTRQRIDQVLDKKISKLPEFENEKSIYDTLSVYRFSKETLDELYVSEPLIPYYVKTKYKLDAQKNEIDYVIENNLLDTTAGIKILKRNNCTFIQDKLYKLNFPSLFEKYVEENNIISLTPSEHIESFRSYLNGFNIDLDTEILKGISFETKIKHSSFLLNYGSNNYYWFVRERYDELFLTKIRDYLENFYGFGYVDYFFNNNIELCKKNSVFNPAQLFIVIKAFFEKEFFDEIEFIRNPSIATKGLERDQFLRELIEEWQPIKYEEFVAKLEKEYGIKKSNFIANYYCYIQDFKTEDGYLTTSVEAIDENNSIIKLIRSYLHDKDIVPYKTFVKDIAINLNKDEKEKYTSKFFIKRLGYKVTNCAVFSSKYNSIFDVMNTLCDRFPTAIAESELKKYYPIESLDNKYDSIKQNCLLLRFSDTSFLNVKKMIPREEVIAFREELAKLLPEGEIFTIRKLNEFIPYKHLKNKYLKLIEIIQALNNDFLVSIIQSSTEITYYDGLLFVFGKGKKLSPKQIIRSILEKENSIDRYELLDILSSSFGIELGNPTASYFAEMGFFFSTINNKIYKTKELYNNELSSYLDSMEENENVE